MFQLLIVLLSLVLHVSKAYPAELQLLAEVVGQDAANNAIELETPTAAQMEQAGQAEQALTLLSPAAAGNIQHHVLQPERIPLPITISTRPGLRTVIAPETITLQEHGVAKIGDVLQKIPTAVSHQSQTVVHKHANVYTPIVAPAVRTISAQVLRAYHTPLILQPSIGLHTLINQN